jgi:hypothetical protein
MALMAAVAAGLTATPSALAQAGAGAPLAVLGVEATDGAPDAVASAITDALRQRVSGSKDLRLVPGRDLIEVKLVFSCPDEAPSCMAQAAQSLGASRLIFGSVKKAPDGYLVTLKMLDANKARVDAWVAEQITRAQASGPAIRGPVQKWFATLTGSGAAGTVRISSDVVGASVLLDGLPVAMTTDQVVELGSVPAGRHEIVISKPGHEPLRREFNLAAGGVEDIQATLSVTPPAFSPDSSVGQTGPSPADTGEPMSGMKIAAWSTLGVGAVSLGLGAFFGVQVQNISSDLDPYRRFECDDGTIRCDRNMNVIDEEVDLDEVNRLKDDGDQAELMQWVFYGAGVALLGTSGYLFYKAYGTDADQESTPSNSDMAWLQRLQVLPTLGRDGGGVAARLRF